MESTKLFGKDDAGCIIDGSAQSADYINLATVKAANEYGGNIAIPEGGEDYSEMLSYAGDEAVEYLNTLCDESVSFTFEDNSLFLLSNEDEEN